MGPPWWRIQSHPPWLCWCIFLFTFSESAKAIIIDCQAPKSSQHLLKHSIYSFCYTLGKNSCLLHLDPWREAVAIYLYSICPYFRYYCISSLICGLKLVWLSQNTRISSLELHNHKVDNYLSGILKNNSMQGGSYKAHPPFCIYAHLVLVGLTGIHPQVYHQPFFPTPCSVTSWCEPYPSHVRVFSPRN